MNRYLFSNYVGLALGEICDQVPALDVCILRWRSRDLQKCHNNPFTSDPGDMPTAAGQQTALRMVSWRTTMGQVFLVLSGEAGISVIGYLTGSPGLTRV